MMKSTLITPGREDLTQLAQNQFTSAMTQCNTCAPYHAIWPYLRITGAVGGVEADEPFLQPLLQSVLTHGVHNILLAGSADSGVTALVHRAMLKYEHSARLTVIDRCATPLRSCQEYAQNQGIELATIQDDMAMMSLCECADLVIGHSVLPFIYENERHNVLLKMAKALKPGGHLLLTVRIAPANLEGKAVKTRSPEDMAKFVLQGLAERSIELPCPTPTFLSMVRDFFLHRSYQLSQLSDTSILSNELESIGLGMVDVRPLGHGNNYVSSSVNRAMGWAYVAKKLAN